MSKVRNEGARELGGGWRVARLAFLVALVLGVVGGVVGLMETGAAYRGASGVVTFGRLLLIGLAAFGVWRGARWGAWLGGVIAAVMVVSVSVTLLLVQTQGVDFGPTVLRASPLSLLLSGASAVAYAVFLAALLRLRLTRRV